LGAAVGDTALDLAAVADPQLKFAKEKEMVSRKAFLVGVLVASFAVGAVVSALPSLEYKIDPAHSMVIFKVLNGDVSFVYGRFNDISGTVSIDNRDEPKELAIKAEVEAKSVDTNDKKRDKHLKKEDFLDVKQFKKITFETKKNKRLEDGKFELTGDLTLLGETHPLTVVFEVTGVKKLGIGKYTIGGEATFTIKRSEFGMDKMPEEIADEVTVTVSIQATRDVPPAG
jgi:polyisoprenoid-binding protein YceI